MKLPAYLHLRVRPAFYAPLAFVLAGFMAIGGALFTANLVESRSAAIVSSRLIEEGIEFATVDSDGLQVWLSGTAPNEAARFRAMSVAGSVVDSARIHDALEVIPVRAIEAPRFSVEMLRNDDGISLIGLLPETPEGKPLAAEAAALAAGFEVSDMLETAAFPPPDGWSEALEFGLAALKMLPRSKISVAADGVQITAISDSEAQKRKFERALDVLTPAGLPVNIDISAPRPVLTPFTLRFVLDQDGARFDACSADTERARDRILAAAAAAGVEGQTNCTVGLGVPSPSWAEAAEAAIKAVSELGAGSVTFSDADVTLLAAMETSQSDFDRVVGEFETSLPDVFSLKATLPPRPEASDSGPAEFTASLNDVGRVELRGRLTDEMLRAAVDSFARAQFGASNVYTATRMDADLPDGWPVRVLAGLESLAQLASGRLLVRADTVEVTGVTGSQSARGRIAQILSDKLGQGQTFKVDVRYDEALDPLAALPTPEECIAAVNAALAVQKITFAPGSAEIDAGSARTVEALADALRDCPDMRFEIAGHTDAQGSEEGNRALSQARAEAVLLALQGRRLSVAGLTAVGYGEARPIADNATETGREANRRIELTPVTEAAVADMGDVPPAGTAVAGAGPSFAPVAPTIRPIRRPADP